MPDLATHVITSKLLFGKWFARYKMAPLFLGVVLPDVLGRVPRFLFPKYDYVFDPGHSLLPLTAFTLGIALLFRKGQRRFTFCYIYLGVLLHLFADLCQSSNDALGNSAYGELWLYPFSNWTLHLNLFFPHQTVYWLPLWLGLLCLVQWFDRKRDNES